MWQNWVWSLGWEDPWRRTWQLTPVFLPGESHGQRSLVGCSPWGHKEMDMTEWLSTHDMEKYKIHDLPGFRAVNFLISIFITSKWSRLCSVQLNSVTQLFRLCDPMNHSTPGLPVHYQIPELTQTHVHWVSDAIQPSHPLFSPSPSALNLSQHQGLSKCVSSLHQVAKELEFQLQHQSFQWTPRTDLL